MKAAVEAEAKARAKARAKATAKVTAKATARADRLAWPPQRVLPLEAVMPKKLAAQVRPT